jgi:predicted AAA+ superfamily ATPase
VIAAGSLLEFALKKVRNFPVGRVEFLNLYPLNFSEYLDAIGHQAAVEQLKKVPAESFAHPSLLELFNQYAIMGGMPEAISTYIDMDSLTGLPQVYESIWGTYKKDVEKYAPHDSDRKVIRHIMETAPLYLDQRIRFQNFGQSNYRSREVGEAFRTLGDARVIQLIYPTTELEMPIKPDLRKSPRLQFLDTGLINHELGIQAEMLALNDLSLIFRGAVIPHLLFQELISLNSLNTRKLCFWVRQKKQSSSEVDLVYPYHEKVIPIEIKSGPDGSLRSLHQFVDQCNHSYAVRIFAGEFSIIKTKTPAGKPYWLMNLPYYLGTKIPECIAYLVENYPGLTKTS